jgi:hypothetical protein
LKIASSAIASAKAGKLKMLARPAWAGRMKNAYGVEGEKRKSEEVSGGAAAVGIVQVGQ